MFPVIFSALHSIALLQTMIITLFFFSHGKLTETDSGSEADYPRAVIYDFVCRLPEYSNKGVFDDDLHTSLVEFPTYTYVCMYSIILLYNTP